VRGWKASEEKNGWYMDQLKQKGMSIVKPSAQLAADLKKIGDVMLQDWLKKAGPDGQAAVEAFRKM
jgi:TRAP-type C4-dicarboxylate transport system substrate-binding protein